MTEQTNVQRHGTFELTYEIDEHLGVLSTWTSEARGTNNAKELNKISWNGRNPVIDIRSWTSDDNGNKTPGKGITLNDREARELCKLLAANDYNKDRPRIPRTPQETRPMHEAVEKLEN